MFCMLVTAVLTQAVSARLVYHCDLTSENKCTLWSKADLLESMSGTVEDYMHR